MIADMLKYYTLVQQNQINLIYNGPIWSEVVEEIGETLKKRLEIEALPLVVSQSIFSVFVEQMYNILYYSAEKNQFRSEETGKEFDVASGVFILGSKDKKYYIQCGNKICNSQIQAISQRIDHLNSMDKAEIRKYYKERMKAENDNADSKGAGIGLIEIARRASSKIDYAFEPLDDTFSFFTLYVDVG